MREYAAPNYLCFVVISALVMAAIFGGDATVNLLIGWLIYGIFSTAWLQVVHPPRVTPAALFYLYWSRHHHW